MHYYISKKLNDFHRRYNNLPVNKQRAVIGLSAGLLTTFAAAAWVAFMPDRHEELEKWSESYTDHCYTHDYEEDTLKSRMARDRVGNIHDHLLTSFPFGAVASDELNEYLEENVFCFGDGYKGKTVSNWPITGVTIIDEKHADNLYAADTLSEDIRDFWNKNVDDIEERLIARDALFFSRFQPALLATYLIDQQYGIHYLAYGDDVFNSPAWQELKNNPVLGRTVTVYENARLNSENPMDNPVPDTVLQDTLYAFLTDGESLNEDDLKFMNKYYPKLHTEGSICVSRNSDGICTVRVPTYSSPPRRVHSTSLAPGTLVEFINVLYSDRENSFVSVEQIDSWMQDREVRGLHSNDADYSFSRIFARINQYNTQKHYKDEKRINPDELYTVEEFKNLNSRADNIRPRF